MLKKSLIMASVLVFASTAMCYAEENAAQKAVEPAAPAVAAPAVPHCKKPPMNPEFKKTSGSFLKKRLKLTDEQKAKAEQIRQKGHEQMKPIMEKLKEKTYGSRCCETFQNGSRNAAGKTCRTS